MADNTPAHHMKMVRAFALVENPNHWKDPIDAFVGAAELEAVCEAITYLTSTVATVTPGPTEGRFHVTAAGYRAGPAGDH